MAVAVAHDDDEDAEGSTRNNAGADDGRGSMWSVRPTARPSTRPIRQPAAARRFAVGDSPLVFPDGAPEIQSEFSIRSCKTLVWILSANYLKIGKFFKPKLQVRSIKKNEQTQVTYSRQVFPVQPTNVI